MLFSQSPRTRKQARPNVALPSARAGGLVDLEIIVDTRERYAYRFAGQTVSTVSRPLPCGDYGVVAGAGSWPRSNASPSAISSAA